MKRHTPTEAKNKIYRYCAYQERHHQEVRDKLYSFGLYKDDVEEILTHLITEGFINEERFARAFAGGKYRMQQWGKVRITHELESRGLSAYCVRAGLSEIEDQHYLETLDALVRKKAEQTEAPNAFILRDKVARFVIQKGFESDLVWSAVKRIIPL